MRDHTFAAESQPWRRICCVGCLSRRRAGRVAWRMTGAGMCHGHVLEGLEAPQAQAGTRQLGRQQRPVGVGERRRE